MNRTELNERIPGIVAKLVDSVHKFDHLQHLDRVYLPDRQAIIDSITALRQIIFPGYFGQQGLTSHNVSFHIGEIVSSLIDVLYEQVRFCLRYREHIPGVNGDSDACIDCDREAGIVVSRFFDRIPAVREMLASDVTAAFEGDPAAQNTDETIYSYPGLFAIMVQRLAHEFYKLNVPLLPRIMTEHAHSRTGIDIHPGAQLGKSFFIDHGTGIVIGETTTIGNNVKIYQGVTLGALAPAYGQALRGQKRHPTIGDDVTIYAGATILGGDTIIGNGVVIGGNVFITSSVPQGNQVSAEAPRLRYRDRRPASVRRAEFVWDFQI